MYALKDYFSQEEYFESEESSQNEIIMTGPQSDFLRKTCKFPLFVAGFGAGKSKTMVTSIFNDLSIPHNRPMKIGAYAPTYDLLNLITIPYITEFLEDSDIDYDLNKSKFILTLETNDQIILRSLNNPSRIVGYQVFRSHIDELDTLKEKDASDAWNKVVARNRQPVPILDINGRPMFHKQDFYYGPEDKKILIAKAGQPMYHMNRISGYTTPEGFRFAYNKWEKEPSYGYELVRAPTYSNPHNPPDYIEQLKSTYPAGLIDAYIEGLFVNLVGKSVYPKFSREKHHTDAFVESGDILDVGMDFNVVHGASAIHVLRDGIPCAVDEIHDAYDTDEQIAILKNRYPNNPINVYPDATGTHRTSSNTTETDIAKLNAAGFKVFHDYSNPPIKDRVMSFNAMIMNGKGEIRYKVNTKTCPNLTNSLEKQIWNENGLPDKSNGLDHIVDGAGYYVFYKFGITKPTSTVTTHHMY